MGAKPHGYEALSPSLWILGSCQRLSLEYTVGENPSVKFEGVITFIQNTQFPSWSKFESRISYCKLSSAEKAAWTGCLLGNLIFLQKENTAPVLLKPRHCLTQFWLQRFLGNQCFQIRHVFVCISVWNLLMRLCLLWTMILAGHFLFTLF